MYTVRYRQGKCNAAKCEETQTVPLSRVRKWIVPSHVGTIPMHTATTSCKIRCFPYFVRVVATAYTPRLCQPFPMTIEPHLDHLYSCLVLHCYVECRLNARAEVGQLARPNFTTKVNLPSPSPALQGQKAPASGQSEAHDKSCWRHYLSKKLTWARASCRRQTHMTKWA
jgi:hypothetical protein